MVSIKPWKAYLAISITAGLLITLNNSSFNDEENDFNKNRSDQLRFTKPYNSSFDSSNINHDKDTPVMIESENAEILSTRQPTENLREPSNDEEFIADLENEFYKQASENTHQWLILHNYFTSMEKGDIALQLLECNETKCRAEISFSSADQGEEILSNLGEGPLSNGGFFHFNDSGKSLTLYINSENQAMEES